MEIHIKNLTELIKTFGYWSFQVQDYNNMLLECLGYTKYKKIHDKAKNNARNGK